MIVFLSSSARSRYADDIIRMLALPHGGQMQFRYSAKWLADDVRAQVPRGELAGELALICYVADSSAADPYGLVPVRFARIIRAEQVGTSYILTLAADAFAANVSDTDLRSAMTIADRSRLPSAAGAANELYGMAADFDPRPHKRRSFDAFETTAQSLSRYASFATEQTAFFSVRHISEVSGRSWFGTWPAPNRIDRGAFMLRTGKRYECEVYCLRFFEKQPDLQGVKLPPEELTLVAEANDDSLQFASTTRSVIDSRYDVKRFIFAEEPEVLRRVSGFRLFLSAAGDIDGQARQDISLQMVFGGSILMAAVRALSIGIATAGPAMIAANASNKLYPGTAIVMIALGILAGIAAIFPSFRKP
ncbi:hypothetical protein U1763_19605 [Sphingomonas sp. LB2R24]|uniref:hypothetical protein n=1 Tax=Sphingomonas sorbitolis TaxID=3096165 RepID=UPI002FC65189